MSDVWIGLIIVLSFAALFGIYIVTSPVSPSQKKALAIFAFVFFILPLSLLGFLADLPTNVLYVLTLASIPLLALGILLLYTLVKSFRVTGQTLDQAQNIALLITIMLTLPLLYLAPICIFLLVQRSYRFQDPQRLLFVLIPTSLLYTGLRGVIASLRKSRGWYSREFASYVGMVGIAIVIGYYWVHNLFHLF